MQDYMNKKVIITGADGFIGSYVVNEFVSNGYEVLAFGTKEKPSRLPTDNPFIKYVQWDMMTPSYPTYSGEYEYFLHFAWYGSSGELRKNFTEQMKNVYATDRCIRIAKDMGCKKFICAGSLMEYEVERATHYFGPTTSTNYYGLAKLAAHYSAKQTAKEVGIDLVWAIITNAYGVGETAPRFVKTTIEKCLRGEQLEFNSNGLQMYDFIYVSDAARVFYKLAELGYNNCEYVIGSGNPQQLFKFVHTIAEICGNDKVYFNMMNKVDSDLPRDIFDVCPLRMRTGFVPEVSFEEGIKKTKEWIENDYKL